jgi:hypothetical protein
MYPCVSPFVDKIWQKNRTFEPMEKNKEFNTFLHKWKNVKREFEITVTDVALWTLE